MDINSTPAPQALMLVEGGHAFRVDPETGDIDYLALESDYHNGPHCVRCDEWFCEHCQPRSLTEPCDFITPELPGMEFEVKK
jgi:hypothetical protein